MQPRGRNIRQLINIDKDSSPESLPEAKAGEDEEAVEKRMKTLMAVVAIIYRVSGYGLVWKILRMSSLPLPRKYRIKMNNEFRSIHCMTTVFVAWLFFLCRLCLFESVHLKMFFYNNGPCGYRTGALYALHWHISRCRQCQRADDRSARSFATRSPQPRQQRTSDEAERGGQQCKPALEHETQAADDNRDP